MTFETNQQPYASVVYVIRNENYKYIESMKMPNVVLFDFVGNCGQRGQA